MNNTLSVGPQLVPRTLNVNKKAYVAVARDCAVDCVMVYLPTSFAIRGLHVYQSQLLRSCTHLLNVLPLVYSQL